MNSRNSNAVIALAALVGLISCAARDETSTTYTPGLGEIMTFTQMRHTKLWFAGEASNWDLAAYEIDELEEGFHDAVAFHPTHKDSPVPLAEVLPAMTDAPVVALRASVSKHDKAAFETAFDSLTAGCNNCHRAMKFGFNVVQRPTAEAFPNQNFSVPVAAQ
ncbi:MAG: hypothetical protein ABI769_03135 [Pseudomonadota bacterium]